MPVSLCFEDEKSTAINIIDYFSTVVFIVDIAFNFITAFKEKGILVTSYKMIAVKYIKTTFLIDLVGSFPYEFVNETMESGGRDNHAEDVLNFLKLFKLLRMFRMGRIFSRFEDSLNISIGVLRFSLLMFVVAWMIHWITCIYWSVVFNAGFDDANIYTYSTGNSDPWLPNFNFLTNNRTLYPGGIDDVDFNSKYVTSFFWTVRIITGCGKSIDPKLFDELVLTVVFAILGVFMYAFVVGGIKGSMQADDADDTIFLKRIDQIMSYLRSRSVPINLQNRINNYYIHKWKQKSYSVNSSATILQGIHPSLSMELNVFLHEPLIQKVSLFSNIKSAECIILILELIQSRVCIPQEVVIYQGEVGTEMYIIVSGSVQVEIKEEEETILVATLKDGDVFGERALICNEIRNASVRCCTFTELLVLQKTDFFKIAKLYPMFFQAVEIELNDKKNQKGWDIVKHNVKAVPVYRAITDDESHSLKRKLSIVEKQKKRVSISGKYQEVDKGRRLERLEGALMTVGGDSSVSSIRRQSQMIVMDPLSQARLHSFKKDKTTGDEISSKLEKMHSWGGKSNSSFGVISEDDEDGGEGAEKKKPS